MEEVIKNCSIKLSITYLVALCFAPSSASGSGSGEFWVSSAAMIPRNFNQFSKLMEIYFHCSNISIKFLSILIQKKFSWNSSPSWISGLPQPNCRAYRGWSDRRKLSKIVIIRDDITSRYATYSTNYPWESPEFILMRSDRKAFMKLFIIFSHVPDQWEPQFMNEAFWLLRNQTSLS